MGQQSMPRKSWVTSAAEADSYVWTSRASGDDGGATLWLVPSDTDGLTVVAPYDGLGLRGNASSHDHGCERACSPELAIG